MNYLLLIPFALIPSLVWLLFYLKKDDHPESKSMILKIFFYGMLATIPTALIGLGFIQLTEKVYLTPFLVLILNIFVGVAFVEELLKYLVVRLGVLNSSEFDEPVDTMIYMIVAALGFAALENIFYLLATEGIFEIFLVNFFRFIGAVFLHALLSGALGYFLALSFYNPRQKVKLIFSGFFLVVFLHGIFNYVIKLIGQAQDLNSALLLVSILIVMLATIAIFVSYGFKRLKKIKSICKIN